MSFTLYATPFVDGTSRVPSVWLNKVRVDTSQAIDGAGGGAYTPTAKIQIGGTAGLEWNGTGNGAWPLVSSRTVTMRCPLVIVGTAQPATSGTDADQTIELSDVANVMALKTKLWNAAGSAYTWISLGRPPDGNDMASVVVTTKGIGANNNPGTKATYQIIRWAVGTAFETMSTATADAHTYGPGNWLTTAVATTVTVNAHATIDGSTYEYALLITHPGDGATTSAMYVYGVSVNYTCTKMQIF